MPEITKKYLRRHLIDKGQRTLRLWSCFEYKPNKSGHCKPIILIKSVSLWLVSCVCGAQRPAVLRKAPKKDPAAWYERLRDHIRTWFLRCQITSLFSNGPPCQSDDQPSVPSWSTCYSRVATSHIY